MKPEAGDKVKITTTDKTFEGILMPQEKDAAVIKLKSGYNIGIENKKIKKIELVEKYKESKQKKMSVKENKKLPTIAILHTGGTIASKVDYESGAVTAHFTVDDLLGMFPELKEIANFKSELVSNMMSEDMRFPHYQKIASSIKKHVESGVDGIIIGHGTDTLAITSSALSFMFDNLPIPVLVVGAQRSSDRGSSDAAMNLVCASEFISKTDFAGVAVCLHESMEDNTCLIMPACKTRKMHTSRRDAFKVINDTPIARINYNTRKIEFLKKNYPKKNNEKLVLKDKFEDKVAVIRTHPHMSSDFFDVLNSKKYKGLVLEATGIGQAPTNIKENLPIYESLKKFISSGGLVVLTSQCIFGRVHPFIYANCRRLADIGVVFGEDMLTETAHVKLAWLLANNPKEVKELMTQNLKGEITECTSQKEFLE